MADPDPGTSDRAASVRRGRLTRSLTPLTRWVPAPFRDPAQRPGLLGWLGVGLAVRLAIMPFSVSADMLAVWWRSHLIAYRGELFGEHLVNMGAHYLHAAWLRLTDPLTPPAEQVWTDRWFFDDFIPLAPQVVRDVAVAEWSAPLLTVLKGLYLLADLAAGAALVALVAGAGARAVRRAWIFWMLSPIGLYATYLYGRYEMLAVVFVVLAVLALERRRPWASALLVGVAITMRGYPLLLVPFMGLVAGVRGGEAVGVRVIARQLAWMGVAAAPFALAMAVNRALAGTVGELARLQEIRAGSTFLAFTVPVDGPGQLYVFVLVVALLLGGLAGRQWGWWGAAPVTVGELWVWLLVIHVAMFAVATFSAHYVAWLTPFVALALARRPTWRGVLWLHLLQVALVLAFIDLIGGPDATLGLLLPAAPAAAEIGSLRELLLTDPVTAEQLQGVLRTGFVAASLLLVWPAVRELWTGPADAAAPAGEAAREPVAP